MKITEKDFKIKQFKDKSSSWWLNNKHYHLNTNNEIVLVSGGVIDQIEIEYLKDYIFRNKKVFSPREESILDKEEKTYMTLNFGKYSGKNLAEIKDLDRRYLMWLKKETKDEKLKEQIIEILK